MWKTEIFHFEIAEMSLGRTADYQFSCLGGCVFLDFNLGKDQRIYLKRISFDGFGCCNLEDPVRALQRQYSELFLYAANQRPLHQKALTKLTRIAIGMNKDQVWSDAIEQYYLLPEKITDFSSQYRHKITFANGEFTSLYGEDYFGDKEVFWTTHQSILNSLWQKAQDQGHYPLIIHDLNFDVKIHIADLVSLRKWLIKNQPFQLEAGR